MPMKFEYRVEVWPDSASTGELESHLNRFGNDGWELVRLEHGATWGAGGAFSPVRISLIFRRAKRDD
jgi:hypothetical protein